MKSGNHKVNVLWYPCRGVEYKQAATTARRSGQRTYGTVSMELLPRVAL